MNFRCFKWVAAFALWIGAGNCAFFTPAARAGDRIEFSAPAIPLSVPCPDVEIKQPSKTFSAVDVSSGIVNDADMIPPPEEITIPRQKNRNNDPWRSSLLQDNDPDQRDADGWLSVRSEQDRFTNGISWNMNMQRGWNEYVSDTLLRHRESSETESGQKLSRFGAQNGYANDHARQENRFGQVSSPEKEASFWARAFNRDVSSPNRPNAFRFMPEMDGFMEAGGADQERAGSPGRTPDSARAAAQSSSYEIYTPVDQSQSRQTSEQFGGSQEYLRAWEPPPSRPSPSRTYSKPDDTRPSRVTAPNKPVRLLIPKRPGDPF